MASITCGNQLIREYMLREYPEPKDFESFLYVSQVLQDEGIKIGAEHLRRIMPHNMGSLFWQIDDCWPVASWSSIDYTAFITRFLSVCAKKTET